MEEEQISGSINSFSDQYSPIYNSSHDTNPNNYYYYDDDDEEEESGYDHRTKRSKHAPILEEEEDRISALPDSILLSILCFLPINNAIKTGVLSKRWVSLWTSLPSLSFDSNSFKYLEDFTRAVNDTLLLHRAPKLTKFDIRSEYDTDLDPRLDIWVRFATNAKVDQLRLYLSPPDPLDPNGYQLPQHLYANEFVSEFNFSFCNIKPIGLLNWVSLKHLCIQKSALREDVIRKVLVGSPRLESLELHDCYGFHRLDIVSESLRKLVIDGYLDRDYIDNSDGGSDEAELEIVAPKIHSLEIVGDFSRKKCRIKNVSALVEVKLGFYLTSDFEYREEEDAVERHEDNVKKLLESLHHVKNLTVGIWCLTALSIMSVKHLPSPLSKCKCLTIQTSMGKCDLPGIGSLLQSSPYVETLVIDITSWGYVWPALVRDYDVVNHWKSKEIYFKLLLLRLKSVKILCFAETLHQKEFILVVKFLLKNAKVLEKMVIIEPQSRQNPTRNMLRKSLQVAQKLLSFPRSSPNAVVMFPY
ncbi:putative F-box protein At1g49610 [Castanea sativa]|uniref:putative F-box protein At1g49610 n=1 Tax=Castanea sativa TaxID=21020 RepID=UPI003F6538C5